MIRSTNYSRARSHTTRSRHHVGITSFHTAYCNGVLSSWVLHIELARSSCNECLNFEDFGIHTMVSAMIEYRYICCS